MKNRNRLEILLAKRSSSVVGKKRLVKIENLPLRDAMLTHVPQCGKKHGRDATRAGSKCRVDSNERCNIAQFSRSNGKSGTRVETIPSEPEAESSQKLEGDGVGCEVVGLVKRIPMFVVEASETWAQNDGSNQGCDSASHVDRTRSGKINGSRAKEGISSSVGKESIVRPKCVGNLKCCLKIGNR